MRRNPIILVIGIIISIIAVYVIIVSAMVITKFIKEGPKPDGMPFSYRCIINVTQDGMPLEGATVTLWPDDQSLAKWGIIYGTTDAKGNARIKIDNNKGYDGAFKGDYKVTIEKVEPSNDKDIQFVRLVDPQYSTPDKTPFGLTIKGSAKVKVDVGSAVRIEEKSFRAKQKDEVNTLLTNAQPCRITILQNGKPVPNAEVILEGDFMKYARLHVDFKGTTDTQGTASIAAVSEFAGMRGETETYPEGMPADTFEVKVEIKDSKDFDLRVGKKLGSVTISNQPFEKKYDLKYFPSRW